MARRVYTVEEIISLCEPVFRNRPVIRASLFGSYARGEQTPKSDIDFLVEYEDGATLLDDGGLFEDLKRTLKIKIDLVDYGARQFTTNPEFWENILKEEMQIYVKQ